MHELSNVVIHHECFSHGEKTIYSVGSASKHNIGLLFFDFSIKVRNLARAPPPGQT